MKSCCAERLRYGIVAVENKADACNLCMGLWWLDRGQTELRTGFPVKAYEALAEARKRLENYTKCRTENCLR